MTTWILGTFRITRRAHSATGGFTSTESIDRIQRWHAFVPSELELTKALPAGQTQVSHVPIYECRELLAFVEYFAGLLPPAGHVDANAVRVMVMIYCHIMESDLVASLIWNQLRLLAGLPAAWTFTAKNNKGVEVVCEYPSQKYPELIRLSSAVGQPIGELLGRLWVGNLRNAFSHSAYFLTEHFIPTRGSSPISRRGSFGVGSSRTFNFTELAARYAASRALLDAVVEEHRRGFEAVRA